jgi:hypothetical protein
MPAALEGQNYTLQLSSGDDNSASSYRTVTDGLLHYEFPGLPADTYTMRFSSWNHLYMPGTRDPAAADSLLVNLEQVATYSVDFTDSYATISGRFIGDWLGVRTAYFLVTAYADGSGSISSCTSRDDGSFLLEILVPQDVRLLVSSTLGGQWVGGESFETAQVFPLQAGDHITDVTVPVCCLEVWLEGPGFLTEHRGEVVLRKESGLVSYGSFYRADPLWLFTLGSGRHYLQVNGQCHDQVWAPQWYGGAAELDEAIPIDLVAGELRRLDFQLQMGAQISGEVLRHDGQRPASVRCRIYTDEDSPVCYYDYFDHGIFSITGLGDGEYYLACREDHYALWWHPGTYYFSEATPITITDLVSVDDVVWHLPPSGKAVRP